MECLSLCEKILRRDGSSQWVFLSPEKTSQDSESGLTLRVSPGKGTGVFSRAGGVLPGGKRLLQEESFICLPIGKHRARVCLNCLKTGHSKVKVSEDCPDMFFCSHQCLHAMDDFTSCCGALISEIFLKHKADKLFDVFLFTTLLLYKRLVLNKQGLPCLSVSRMMKQDGHAATQLPSLFESTRIYFNMLTTTATNLLQTSDTVDSINTLMRAILFNSQSFLIPELPNSSLMCHFDTLSKINHSCVPNAILVFTSSSPSSATLVSLREIPADEEITVSYLADLCSSLEHRQNLLHQGFFFCCQCPRCSLEQSIVLSKKGNSSTYKVDFSSLDMSNCLNVVNHLNSLKSVTQKLSVIDKQHLDYLRKGLDALSSTPQHLNRTTIEYIYVIHDFVIAILGLTLNLKTENNSSDHYLRNAIIIQFVGMLHDCWTISHSVVQLNQLSYYLIAASAAAKIAGDRGHISTEIIELGKRLSTLGCDRLKFILAKESKVESNLYTGTERRICQALRIIVTSLRKDHQEES